MFLEVVLIELLVVFGGSNRLVQTRRMLRLCSKMQYREEVIGQQAIPVASWHRVNAQSTMQQAH